jgi:hypothetical protein
MIALLDSDILCYRVGFATEDEHGEHCYGNDGGVSRRLVDV